MTTAPIFHVDDRVTVATLELDFSFNGDLYPAQELLGRTGKVVEVTPVENHAALVDVALDEPVTILGDVHEIFTFWVTELRHA